MPNDCPVTARGVLYPSIKTAAQAHRVTPRTIMRHLDRYGHLDNLHRVQRTRPDLRKPVKIGTFRFESVSEAAKELGVARKTLRNMQHRPAAREYVLRALLKYRPRKDTA
jgi:hypothetical protein